MQPRRDPKTLHFMLFFTALMLTTLVVLWPASAHPDTLQGVAEKGESTLRLTAVTVSPEAPGADTLCSLSVTLTNDGESTVSAFSFRVTVDGVELPAYQRRVFFHPLAPGEQATLELYNFWATESSRPTLAAGGPAVEVELTGARQVRSGAEGAVALADPVSPLPPPRSAGASTPRSAASR